MKIEINIQHGLTLQHPANQIKNIGNTNALRLLKGAYTNKNRFQSRYLSALENVDILKPISNYFLENYDQVKPFSYKEAFKLKNQNFQREVFKTINITEMIENFGATKIAVEGKERNHKNFDKLGNPLPNKTYHAIYETYQINGNQLFTSLETESRDIFLYAVKCWCTSTQHEHWLWIEEKYKNNPLDAIASTFRFHANIIPHIKELKRQGDIMLVELTKEITPQGEIVPLNANQYFRLLTIET